MNRSEKLAREATRESERARKKVEEAKRELQQLVSARNRQLEIGSKTAQASAGKILDQVIELVGDSEQHESAAAELWLLELSRRPIADQPDRGGVAEYNTRLQYEVKTQLRD